MLHSVEDREAFDAVFGDFTPPPAPRASEQLVWTDAFEEAQFAAGLPVRSGSVWCRQVLGYGGKYTVSSDGLVWNAEGRVLYQNPHWRTGHLRVDLYLKGVRRSHYLHRLVAEAFVPRAGEGNYVLHLNGRASDCRACNLSWGTRKENAEHAVAHGAQACGLRNGRGRLSNDDVLLIRAPDLTFPALRALAGKLGITYNYAKEVRRGRWR